MLTITRDQFRGAINAGVDRARHLLTEDDVRRLAEVGNTATRAGGNFASPPEIGRLNVGCPASQANIKMTETLYPCPGFEFACGYDDAIKDIVSDAYDTRWFEGVEIV